MEGKFIITQLYKNGISGYYEGTEMKEKVEFSFQPSSQTIIISDEVSFEDAKKIATQLKENIAEGHVEAPALLYKSKFYNL